MAHAGRHNTYKQHAHVMCSVVSLRIAKKSAISWNPGQSWSKPGRIGLNSANFLKICQFSLKIGQFSLTIGQFSAKMANAPVLVHAQG